MTSIRFLSPKVHGVLDYGAAAALIALPLIFGFEGLTRWLSVAGGAGLIGYSLLTDYTFGAASVISFRTHLLLDLAAAVAFIAAPFAFGWSGFVMGYYFAMAAGVLAVVAFSNPTRVDIVAATTSAPA